jgi:membrane protease YdiL (CAAX protease family)
MKKLVLLIAVFTALMLAGCQALAQGEEVMPEDFLKYLLTGPGIGIVISVGLEKLPFAKRLFDQIQDLEWKRMTVLGLCVILPTLSLVVGWQLGYFELSEITVFNVLAAAWEAFTTSTVLHGFIREKQETG